MNPHKPQSQARDSYMTFMVGTLFAVALVSVIVYFGLHDVLPAVREFLSSVAHPRNN